MNWEQIKYIFQIPISWYKKIHERVFNAYGTNFIKIKEGYYGGMEIGLDTEELDKYLEDNGSVKSVDDVEPDDDGNIELNAARLTEDQTFTGDNTFSEPITLGNSGAIGDNGTSLDIAHGQNGISLNGTNAQLLVNEPSRLYSDGADAQIASRAYCRLNFARSSHTHGNINNDGTITTIGSGITTDYIIGATSTGELYRKQIGDLGLVKSVNSNTPDPNGNVTIDCVTSDQLSDILELYVTNQSLSQTLVSYATQSWVQSQGYLTDADLSDYVTQDELSQTLTTTLADYVTQTTLTNTLSDYATQTDIQDFPTTSEMEAYVASELEGYVTSVDGHEPNASGAVSFNLTASKWLKSDANGHIVTTNDEPIVPSTSSSGYIYNNNGTISYTSLSANKWVKTTANGLLTTTDDVPVTIDQQSTGYLYNNAGTLQYKDDEYVTLSTDQTITGVKTFNGSGVPETMISLGAGAFLQATALSTYGNTYTMLQGQMFKLANVSGSVENSVGIAYAPSESWWQTNTVPALVFLNGDNGLHQGGIYRDTGLALVRDESMHIQDTHGLSIDVPANKAVLANHPTETSTSSKAIATVGYCQSHFGSGGGTVTSVDHVSPDAQGNVQLNAIRTINGHNGDSVGNFAGVVTSVNGETPNDGAVTLSVVETVNSTSPDANGNVDVGTVKEVDGHSPNAQGAVSFGLTASKWVKTDSSGHLTTTNDTPVSIPSDKTGQTTNIILVTGVTWNGTQLVVARTQLSFTNGVLTGRTSLSNTTIATVAYT